MRAAGVGGLQSSGGEAAYHRAKKERPTEYTENAELRKTEMDAVGIKIDELADK